MMCMANLILTILEALAFYRLVAQRQIQVELMVCMANLVLLILEVLMMIRACLLILVAELLFD